MEVDFEKYLNGEMGEQERQDFERQLAKDPALRANLDEQRAFLERLKTQALREKIAAAIAEGDEGEPPQKTLSKVWLGLLFGLLLATVAAYWFFSNNEKLPPEAPPVETWEIPENQSVAPPAVEKEMKTEPPAQAPTPKKTIAEKPTVQPPSNQSGVRGEESGNADWDKLVASVWATRFDPQPGAFTERFSPTVDLLKAKEFTDAFVQLKLMEMDLPINDTLIFLQGYCSLEMREGGAALAYFAKLEEGGQWAEEVEWYSVLAHLLEGEKEKAGAQAATIAGKAGHRYREQARMVVKCLN